MASAWSHDDAGKSGRRPSGSGRPLFAAAQLQVELLEDRLAPSFSLPLHPVLPAPIHGPGTIGFDQVILPKLTASTVKPRGFTFNALGPVQTGPVPSTVASQPVALRNSSAVIPAPARAMDPGGGGWHELTVFQPQGWNPIVHTSFWQTGEHNTPEVTDGWLDELIRNKRELAPASKEIQQSVPSHSEGTTEPSSSKSEPREKRAVDRAPMDKDVPSRGRLTSPPAREQVVCRLVMQARPGYLIALVLVLSWTTSACANHRQGNRLGRRALIHWLPGKNHPGTHPELRPRPARAPPLWGPSEQDAKGQTARSALFVCQACFESRKWKFAAGRGERPGSRCRQVFSWTRAARTCFNL